MNVFVDTRLVPLLREGLVWDLQGLLDWAGALVEPSGLADDVRRKVSRCIALASGDRALLDVVGWLPREDEREVVVDAGEHREALFRGLKRGLGCARDVLGDERLDGWRETPAREQIAGLLAFAGLLQESEAAVRVPARCVGVLREVLAGELARCTADIEEYASELDAPVELLGAATFYARAIEQVGEVGRTLPVAVELDLGGGRRRLDRALCERLAAERRTACIPGRRAGAVRQRREAQRKIRQIKELLAVTGLGREHAKRAPTGPGSQRASAAQ